MHICTKASPMRTNSNPYEWEHPDSTELPDTYFDSTMCDGGELIGGTSVIMSCPHCANSMSVPVPPRGILGGAIPELRGLPKGDNRLIC